MSNWTCELPREECPCVCCQLWRKENELEEVREQLNQTKEDLADARELAGYLLQYNWIKERVLPDYYPSIYRRYPWIKRRV